MPLAETQRALIFDVFFFHRAEAVPQVENRSHDDSNADADSEEQAVGREPDQGDGDNGGSRKQGRRATNGNLDHSDTCAEQLRPSVQPKAAGWQATRS